MDALFDEMIVPLRAARTALYAELHPLLQAQNPDWSMLMRLRDVADGYAESARQLRRMMIDSGAETEAIEEVDRLCEYFDGTANLIAQETGDSEGATPHPNDEEAGPR